MKLYNKYFTITFVLILAITWCTNLSAKNKKVPIYIFGMSASFNDSTVYFTDIQKIDSALINAKNKFLINRSEYSNQLKNYLEANGLNRRTCIVSFAFKQKNAQKKYNKMRNKYLKKGGSFDLKNLYSKDFQFSAISLDE